MNKFSCKFHDIGSSRSDDCLTPSSVLSTDRLVRPLSDRRRLCSNTQRRQVRLQDVDQRDGLAKQCYLLHHVCYTSPVSYFK